MTRKYAHVAFYLTGLITIALLLSGCPAPPSPQVITPTPQVIMQGDTPGREVVQPIELDNCDGKADAKRTEHRTRSVESTISAEVAAKFGVSAEVLSAEVQATVGASVGWTEGQGTSIELVAPPGTRMAFQLVWIGNEQVGIVQNLRASSIPIAFRSFKPTDVRIKSQYDIGCPPTPSAQRPVATPETRSVTPVPSPTVRPATQPVPSGKYPCPLIIKRSQVDAWKVGQTTLPVVDQALNEFAALRPNDAGAFVATTKIPSGVLIATDFGEATGWTRYPVAPIIHSGGYGLFESTGEYTAPKPGACMTIAPTISEISTPVLTAQAPFVWRHNPGLPAPQGYPGAISYTKRDFPGNSDRDWVYGIEISASNAQMLLIAGYAGNLPSIGQMGGASHCFLLITRGPFTSKMDLLSAGVETHELAPNADTLTWAAQKVNDLKAANSSCAQGVDLWVGR